MQSMTGFGHVARQCESLDLVVEIKTVNGRFFDLKARLGNELSPLESAIKAEVQKRISRGRVELFLEVRQKTADLYELNEALVANYTALADELRSLGVSGNLSVSDLLNIPGIIVRKDQAGFSDEEEKWILAAVRDAVELVYESRRAEARHLRREVDQRLENLEALVEQISEYKDDIQQHYRDRLENRLREYRERGIVDEQRLAQEVLYHVDRIDISEEIVRLRSHIYRFQKTIRESDSEAVGKKLDFLCQELNREMNTIVSKSGGIQVTEIGVEGKAEIERLREQVQNIE